MKPDTMNTALDIQREAGSLPDVDVVYTVASTKLGGQFNNDKIEIDMRRASASSESLVRELAQHGWDIEETENGFWILTSNYYPNPPEDMTAPENPEA